MADYKKCVTKPCEKVSRNKTPFSLLGNVGSKSFGETQPILWLLGPGVSTQHAQYCSNWILEIYKYKQIQQLNTRSDWILEIYKYKKIQQQMISIPRHINTIKTRWPNQAFINGKASKVKHSLKIPMVNSGGGGMGGRQTGGQTQYNTLQTDVISQLISYQETSNVFTSFSKIVHILHRCESKLNLNRQHCILENLKSFGTKTKTLFHWYSL